MADTRTGTIPGLDRISRKKPRVFQQPVLLGSKQGNQIAFPSSLKQVDNGIQSMNELKQLESLGLVLPTPAYIIGAILFGIFGWIAFRRGRKTSVSVLTWTGVALMLYPYGVSETWMLWLIGLALSGLAYTKWS